MAPTQISTVNPFSGEVIQTYSVFSEAEIEQKLADAQSQFLVWSRFSLARRLDGLREIQLRFSGRAEECAVLMSREMGKPILQSRAEVKKCLALFDSVFASAEQWLMKRSVDVNPDSAWIEFLPSGPLLAVMPWNFPFWQVIRFAVPQIAAGNVVVLKHASNSTGTSLLLEEIFCVSGMKESLLQALVIPAARVEQVIADQVTVAS